MTKARTIFTPKPRYLSEQQTASRLGMSPSTLLERKSDLEKMGFPRIDELLGGRDGDAIERWCDQRSPLLCSWLGDRKVNEDGENVVTLR